MLFSGLESTKSLTKCVSLLGNYLGPNCMSRFRIVSITSFFLLVSCFLSIHSAWAINDLELVSIDAPVAASTFYTENQEVVLTVKNNSSNFSSSNYRAVVFVDGQFVGEGAGSSGIGAGSSISFSTGVKVNLSKIGEHQIEVILSRAVDPDISNNTKSITVVSAPATGSTTEITSFPYTEDFESGAGDWTAFAYNAFGNSPTNGYKSDFVLGTPTTSSTVDPQYIDSAGGGSNSWRTSATVFGFFDASAPFRYSSDAYLQVVSPVFDLTSFGAVEISLEVLWESPFSADGAVLQQSIDDGITWVNVGSNGDPNNWFTEGAVSSLTAAGAGGEGWAGYKSAGTIVPGPSAVTPYDSAGGMGYASSGSLGSTDWVTAKNIISGGAKKRLRILFTSIRTGANATQARILDEGFAFDDISITAVANSNLTDSLVNDVDSDGRIDPGDTVQYTEVFTNSTSSSFNSLVLNDPFTDSNLSLVAGSVTTSVGSVTTGNTGGDTTVSVNVGTLAAGASVTVTYQAVVGTLPATPATTLCAQVSATATELSATVLSIDPDATATSFAAVKTCFDSFFDSNNDGSPDTDTDGDGLFDNQEADAGTDPNVQDTDGDGDNDFVEVTNGTDPLEPNSKSMSLGSEVCTEWNGFVSDITQILELKNVSSTDITVRTRLLDQFGAQKDSLDVAIIAGRQYDLIVNMMNGFVANQYGTVCAAILSGPADSLDGQLINYIFNGTSYTLAFVEQLVPAKTGDQFVSWNNLQASLDPSEANDFVSSWIQISNSTGTNKTGSLKLYDSEGVLLKNLANVFIPGSSRIDFSTHDLGSTLIGLAVWSPDDTSAGFRVRLRRYYLNDAFGVATGFNAINSVQARVGLGSKLVIPVITNAKTAVVELSNTTSSSVNVAVRATNPDGSVATLPTSNVFIPAMGTRHVVFSDVLTNGTGALLVDSDTVSSVIATAYFYGRGATGNLTFSEAVPMLVNGGMTIQNSYNSFLGQSCRGLFANKTSTTQSGTVDMTRFDGTSLISGLNINIPGDGTFEVDLCSNETQEAYGQVKLTPATPGNISGIISRRNSQGTVEFSLTLK